MTDRAVATRELLMRHDTSWQLMVTDLFDRETSMVLEGRGPKAGLFHLWERTLRMAVDEHGARSLYQYFLRWGDGEARSSAGITVRPEHQELWSRLVHACLLRQVHPPPASPGEEAAASLFVNVHLLEALAARHHAALAGSSRWSGGSVDMDRESLEVLEDLQASGLPR